MHRQVNLFDDPFGVWSWKWRSQWWSTTFAMVLFDGKYKHSKTKIHIFTLACTISEIVAYRKMFNLENLDQSHRVQHLQWFNSMANNNRYTSLSAYNYARSHRLEVVKVCNFSPWKIRSRSRSTTFVMVPFDGEY